jgi:hypothetical protein
MHVPFDNVDQVLPVAFLFVAGLLVRWMLKKPE